MYQYRCDTCDVDNVLDDLATAQAEFTEHADQQHEVVLRRVEPPIDGPIPTVDETATASEPTTENPETTSGNGADG